MSAAEADVMSNLHLAAVQYARNGVHIFPCLPRGKRPATGHGFHDATVDVDRVDLWWRETPDANIGIALGASGVFIVDVDGPEAAAHLAELEAVHGPLPDTYSITTGRVDGGTHLMFRQPKDVTVGNRKIGAGGKLETRGDGGYAIAPPSIHPSGAPYIPHGKWAGIAEPPAWLVELCTVSVAVQVDIPTRPVDQADASLLSIAGRVALGTEGNRNDLLFWAACKAGGLVAAGRVDPERARQMLAGAAERAGLAAGEAAATIQSGFETGAQTPDHGNPFHADDVPPVTVLDDTGQVLVDDGGLPLDPALLDPDRPLHRAVLDEYVRLVARRHAAIMDVAATAPEAPRRVGLTELLAQPDPDVTFRLDGLWPSHGRVLLAAQFKSGKSTMIGNVIRSLVDGTPFLGEHEPAPLDGRVVLIDDELHIDTLRRWYRDQGIVNTDQVDVIALRGRTSTFNILDQHVRSGWADVIRDAGASVIIFDCLRPILDACGLSEDKDAGRFLVAFDELCDEAGVTEAIVVHHMGHSGERSRGDSRLRDWPDVEWRLIRDGDDDDPAAPRYFAAYGRDVDAPERLLSFSETGRELGIGGGSRKDERARWALHSILSFLEEQPDNPSQRRIVDGVGGRAERVRDDIDLAVKRGLVEVIRTGNTSAHRLTDRGRKALHSPRGVA